MNPLELVVILVWFVVNLVGNLDVDRAKALMTPDPPAMEQPADARPLDDRD